MKFVILFILSMFLLVPSANSKTLAPIIGTDTPQCLTSDDVDISIYQPVPFGRTAVLSNNISAEKYEVYSSTNTLVSIGETDNTGLMSEDTSQVISGMLKWVAYGANCFNTKPITVTTDVGTKLNVKTSIRPLNSYDSIKGRARASLMVERDSFDYEMSCHPLVAVSPIEISFKSNKSKKIRNLKINDFCNVQQYTKKIVLSKGITISPATRSTYEECLFDYDTSPSICLIENDNVYVGIALMIYVKGSSNEIVSVKIKQNDVTTSNKYLIVRKKGQTLTHVQGSDEYFNYCLDSTNIEYIYQENGVLQCEEFTGDEIRIKRLLR